MPPSFLHASLTAAAAPARRTCNRPSCHALAFTGRGCDAQSLSCSSARISSRSKLKVAAARLIGSTLSETSQMTPKIPKDPAISRDTS